MKIVFSIVRLDEITSLLRYDFVRKLRGRNCGLSEVNVEFLFLNYALKPGREEKCKRNLKKEIFVWMRWFWFFNNDAKFFFNTRKKQKRAC